MTSISFQFYHSSTKEKETLSEPTLKGLWRRQATRLVLSLYRCTLAEVCVCTCVHLDLSIEREENKQAHWRGGRLRGEIAFEFQSINSTLCVKYSSLLPPTAAKR